MCAFVPPPVSAHVDVGRHFETKTDVAIRGIDPLHGLPPRSSLEGSAGRPIRSHHRPSAIAAESDGSGGGDRPDHETRVEKIMNLGAPGRRVDACQRGISRGCGAYWGVGAPGPRPDPHRARVDLAHLPRSTPSGPPPTRTPVPHDRRHARAPVARAQANRRSSAAWDGNHGDEYVGGASSQRVSRATPDAPAGDRFNRRAGVSPRTGRLRSRPTRSGFRRSRASGSSRVRRRFRA